jgi:hypothetical protein
MDLLGDRGPTRHLERSHTRTLIVKPLVPFEAWHGRIPYLAHPRTRTHVQGLPIRRARAHEMIRFGCTVLVAAAGAYRSTQILCHVPCT